MERGGKDKHSGKSVWYERAFCLDNPCCRWVRVGWGYPAVDGEMGHWGQDQIMKALSVKLWKWGLDSRAVKTYHRFLYREWCCQIFTEGRWLALWHLELSQMLNCQKRFVIQLLHVASFPTLIAWKGTADKNVPYRFCPFYSFTYIPDVSPPSWT